MPNIATHPEHWEERAKEMRFAAEHAEEAKAAMLRVAAEYQKLANRARERLMKG